MLHRAHSLRLDSRLHLSVRHFGLYDWVCDQHRCCSSPCADGHHWILQQRVNVQGRHQHSEASRENQTRCCHGPDGFNYALRDTKYLQLWSSKDATQSQNVLLHLDPPNSIRDSSIYHDQLAREQASPQEANLRDPRRCAPRFPKRCGPDRKQEDHQIFHKPPSGLCHCDSHRAYRDRQIVRSS